MSAVSVSNVVKSFPTDAGSHRRVLNGVSFSAKQGDVIALVGANGSGKSTILSLLSGMSKADAGKIAIDGKPPEEAKIGYVWQNYRASLLPWLTVGENIAFPLKLAGVPKGERTRHVEQHLKESGVNLPLGERVYRLSGGQQQMTCLMRALITHPDVLLLDEPTSALDLQAKWRLFSQLEEMRRRFAITTVWVSHDPDEAVLAADTVLLLSGSTGTVAETIHNECPRPRRLEMLTDPAHLRCRERALNFIFQSTAVTAVNGGKCSPIEGENL